jgi:hypothetical protein
LDTAARKVFAGVNASTDLGSRYSRSRRNTGDAIARNGAQRSTWYSTISFRETSTRKGLRMWASSVDRGLLVIGIIVSWVSHFVHLPEVTSLI